MEGANDVMQSGQKGMDKAFEHLEIGLNKIRAGKASANVLDGVMVDYYGSQTALSGVGSVNTPDAKTLVVTPWEKNMLVPIEKAIRDANLGFNPQNDGVVIRIAMPPLTEERRKALVKQTKGEGEESKIAIRNIRKEVNESLKKLVKDGLPEDEGKRFETKVQELTDKFIARVDELLKTKEKEIMTV